MEVFFFSLEVLFFSHVALFALGFVIFWWSAFLATTIHFFNAATKDFDSKVQNLLTSAAKGTHLSHFQAKNHTTSPSILRIEERLKG